MPSNNVSSSAVTLVQVQQYFKDCEFDDISEERIADFYSMIDDNLYLYVSKPDEEWNKELFMS